MRLAFLPPALEALPWRVLLWLAVLVSFGAAVLWSAAGESFWTYSFSHLIRFGVFVVMAVVISRFPRDLVLFAAYRFTQSSWCCWWRLRR